MIEDLSKHIILIEDKGKRRWSAGDQLSAFKFYWDGNIFSLVEGRVGGYAGEYGVILFCEGKLFLWRDSFGSCLGCDSLDNRTIPEGYNYILDTLRSVKEFDNPVDLLDYLNSKNRDYLFNNELTKDLSDKFIKYIISIGTSIQSENLMETITKSIVLNQLK